jgi:hypothetical protein
LNLVTAMAPLSTAERALDVPSSVLPLDLDPAMDPAAAKLALRAVLERWARARQAHRLTPEQLHRSLECLDAAVDCLKGRTVRIKDGCWGRGGSTCADGGY